eukprot:101661-Pelagomonas_calceolata.AAC.2
MFVSAIQCGETVQVRCMLNCSNGTGSCMRITQAEMSKSISLPGGGLRSRHVFVFQLEFQNHSKHDSRQMHMFMAIVTT